MKTLCVIGGAGLLGSKILAAARGHWRLVSLDREGQCNAPPEVICHRCDVTNDADIHHILNDEWVDAVINCAAITDVDWCEDHADEANLVNFIGAENVARAARESGSNLIFISTDYVFDGRHAPYSEDDDPNPVSVYGRSKFMGEKAVRKLYPKALIARTAVLYGYIPGGRPNFVTWLIGELEAGRSVRIVEDQWGNPTLADDLAPLLLHLLSLGTGGVLHTCGPEILNRYEFARLIASVWECDPGAVEKIDAKLLNQKAPRPHDAGLRTEKMVRLTGRELPPVRRSLIFLREQLQHLRNEARKPGASTGSNEHQPDGIDG